MSGEETSARVDMPSRLDRLLDEIESHPNDSPPVPPPPSPPPAGAPDAAGAAGLLNGLLAHPELLAGLPQLLGAITPLMKGLGGAGAPGSAPGAKRPPDRHTALLRALKPYLSPERRQATETVLELLAVWDALSGMGLTLPGAPSGRRDTSTTGEVSRDV